MDDLPITSRKSERFVKPIVGSKHTLALCQRSASGTFFSNFENLASYAVCDFIPCVAIRRSRAESRGEYADQFIVQTRIGLGISRIALAAGETE